MVRQTSSFAIRNFSSGLGRELRVRGQRVEAADQVDGLRHPGRVDVSRKAAVAFKSGLIETTNRGNFR